MNAPLIGNSDHWQEASMTIVNMDGVSANGTEDHFVEEPSMQKWRDSIRLSFIDSMARLGSNVDYFFDMENGKVLPEHISGEHQSLNSEEKNLAFLWSCFVRRQDLLEPLHRIGADLQTTLPNEGFTALHLAAFSGSVTSCKWLILNGLQINKIVKNLSPLHCAALGNSLVCTKLLLGYGAKIGSTVLHTAVEANATDCLRHLLNAKAKINAVNENGLTVLHEAADRGMVKCLQILISHHPKPNLNIRTTRMRSTPLHLAAENGSAECCQLLIDGGADVKAVDYKEQTALHLAIQNQNIACLEILLDAKCNINAQDKNGSTPLHIALSGPNVAFDVFQILLKRGAYVNISNKVGYTLLHLAAKAQRIDCINMLLNAGSIVNAKTMSGRTPLHAALSGENPASDVLEVLLKRGADVNVSDKQGVTPLHLAAEAKSTECLQVLLDVGCDVNAQDVYGSTPLHETLCGPKLTLTTLDFLLQRGADVNVRDRLGYTALHLASRSQSTDCLEILLGAGCNVNAKTVNGQTPLHVALSRPELASNVLEVLVKKGAEVNVSDIHGITPLHLAVSDQSLDCMELLLDAGSDMNAQDKEGLTPLYKVLSGLKPAVNALKVLLKRGGDVNVSSKGGQTLLHLAVEAGSKKCVEMLLDAGCNVNAQTTSGRTPLHVALSKHKIAISIVKILLKRGAEGNVGDKNGNTPLHMAAKAKHTKCLELLLNAGCGVNVQDNDGSTPLHKALSGQGPAVDAVKILLDRQADPNICDMHWYTPLHLAVEAAYTECVEMLLDAGCYVNAQTESGSTSLHVGLSNPLEAYNTLRVLLNRGADADISNSHGDTPLHLAAKAQNTKCLKLLLDAGCNVNAQDANGSTPLHEALAGPDVVIDVIEALLERGAVVNVKDRDGNTPLHLAALNDIPFNGTIQSVNRLIMKGADVTARANDGTSALSIISQNSPCSINAICQKLDSSISIIDQEASNKEAELELDFSYLLPKSSEGEMVFFNTLHVEGHKHLIEHPLCKAFLHLKWQKIRKFYLFRLLFCFVFVILLTMYVIFALAHECYNAAKRNLTASVICSNDSAIGPFLIDHPQLVESVWHWLVFSAVIKSIRKLVSISGHTSVKDYFCQLTNIFEWFVILSVFFVSCFWPGGTYDWQKNVGGLAVLLAWTDFMILVSQLPVFGIYVEMFTKVQTEFFKLLLAYLCLLIGFTASFCVVFPHDDTFRNPLIGFVKILAMMTGELDFETLRENLQNKTTLLIVFVCITYALFLIFVTVVLMNLLVGIAVNDIQGLYKTAGLSKLVRRTQLIYFLELAILRSFLPKKVVHFLLSLVSLEAPVLYVKPFQPCKKQLPPDILMDAFIFAKQKKKRTNSVCTLSPGLKHCLDNSSGDDERNSYEETRTYRQLEEIVSKLVKNNRNSQAENRRIQHEKKLYEELQQLKDTVSRLVDNTGSSSAENKATKQKKISRADHRLLKRNGFKIGED